jgi:hypothetical protein
LDPESQQGNKGGDGKSVFHDRGWQDGLGVQGRGARQDGAASAAMNRMTGFMLVHFMPCGNSVFILVKQGRMESFIFGFGAGLKLPEQ